MFLFLFFSKRFIRRGKITKHHPQSLYRGVCELFMSSNSCFIGELFKVRVLAALSVDGPRIKYTCTLIDNSSSIVSEAECCRQLQLGQWQDKIWEFRLETPVFYLLCASVRLAELEVNREGSPLSMAAVARALQAPGTPSTESYRRRNENHEFFQFKILSERQSRVPFPTRIPLLSTVNKRNYYLNNGDLQLC